MNEIATPCVKVCVLEPQRDLCLGCGRSRAEIATWTRLSDAGRAEVMAALPARLEVLHADLRAAVSARLHRDAP